MKRLLSIFFISIYLNAAFPLWYYKIKDIEKQKKAFVEILLPLIQNENRKILNLRDKIIKIFKDPYLKINIKEIKFLSKIAKEYKIKDIFNKKEFLKRVDKIPPSLALTQAAIESGWGKSRFVKKANNIFGHWEYSNKGIAPKSRYKHIKISYSLKIFPSLEDSIKAYMLNLNRNRAYKEFRDLRYQYRLKKRPFTGIVAATTLIRYSQKKEKYIKMIQNMIKKNQWDMFDK